MISCKQMKIIAVLLTLILGIGMTSSFSASHPDKPLEVIIYLSEFKIESSRKIFEKDVLYQFVIKNTGNIEHEFMITPKLDKHSHAGGLMAYHDTKILLRVEKEKIPPGASTIQTFSFRKTGRFEFSCHLPGHYEGGMVLPITVR